jgi:hypothetical protein
MPLSQEMGKTNLVRFSSSHSCFNFFQANTAFGVACVRTYGEERNNRRRRG